MKELYIRRVAPTHVWGAVTAEGLALAHQEGQAAEDQYDEFSFDKVFVAPTLASAQTALAFVCGLVKPVRRQLMPVVHGLGDNRLLAEIVTPTFEQALASGMNAFNAAMAVHGEAKSRIWAATAHRAVKYMFTQLRSLEECGDGTFEVGAGFFHSPLVELALWATLDYGQEELSWATTEALMAISDLEGYKFDGSDFVFPIEMIKLHAPTSV